MQDNRVEFETGVTGSNPVNTEVCSLSLRLPLSLKWWIQCIFLRFKQNSDAQCATGVGTDVTE